MQLQVIIEITGHTLYIIFVLLTVYKYVNNTGTCILEAHIFRHTESI